MKNLVSRFVKDESGATAIEYSLIVAFVSVTIITVGATMGTNLELIWGAISTALGTAAAAV